MPAAKRKKVNKQAKQGNKTIRAASIIIAEFILAMRVIGKVK